MKNRAFEKYRPVFVRMVGDLRQKKLDVDRLPYTPLFDEIYIAFSSTCESPISRSEFYWELLVVRKNYKRLVEKLSAG